MKFRLNREERELLLQSKIQELTGILEILEREMSDLSIREFFEKYYEKLSVLTREIHRDYPPIDFSTNDIDKLYRRKHMND